VFFGAKREGVYVAARRRSTGVVLVGLDSVEIGTFAFRESVLAVELKLGNFYRVLAFATNAGI
jgi:hypothetical protein